MKTQTFTSPTGQTRITRSHSSNTFAFDRYTMESLERGHWVDRGTLDGGSAEYHIGRWAS